MERLKLGSILDSLIAVAVIAATALVLVFFRDPSSWLVIALFVVLVVVLAFILAGHTVWSAKDPDKLRPSEHEIRKYELSHGLGSSQNPELTETAVEELPAELNPEPLEVEASDEVVSEDRAEGDTE